MGSRRLQRKMLPLHRPNPCRNLSMPTNYDSLVRYDLHPSVAHVQAWLQRAYDRDGPA